MSKYFQRQDKDHPGYWRHRIPQKLPTHLTQYKKMEVSPLADFLISLVTGLVVMSLVLISIH